MFSSNYFVINTLQNMQSTVFQVILVCLIAGSISVTADDPQPCTMPQILRGSWFSWETGKPTQTVIDDVSMSKRGYCVNYTRDGADYTFVFRDKSSSCYHCVRTYPRTVNVYEKVESPCVTLLADEEPTVERVCKGIHEDQ